MKRQFKCMIQRIFFTLISVCFIGACGDDRQSQTGAKPGAAKTKKTIPVEVILPEIGVAASYYVTTATLEPSSDANINARTTGVVRDIFREEGDDVKTGEVLLLLEDDDQKLRLKQAQQNLTSSKREFDRLSRMKKAGVVSPNEWEAANNAYLSAQTDKELAELALSYTRVAAPFDGRLVWRDVDLGEHVSVGNLLVRIMAIKPLLLRVHVPANRIGQVKAGQQVKLKIDSAAIALKGLVELVSPIVDPLTGTIKVTVSLNQYPKSVRPGGFTEVHMITEQRENAMLLPSVAIIEERGKHFLFVAEDGKAVRKPVEIGFVIGDKTEIISGIEANERVINKGQRSLNDGNLLQIIEPDNAGNKQLISDKSELTNQKESSKRTNL